MFQDTVLHVSVRPSLEYKVPELCLMARDVITGHAEKAQLRNTCEALTTEMTEVDLASYVPELRDALSRKTRAQIIQVCKLVDAYLREICTEWNAFVESVSMHVVEETRKMRRDVERAKEARANNRTSEKEHMQRLQRCKDDLNTMLCRVHKRPTPFISRPTTLVAAIEALRETFFELGRRRVPSDTKLLLKNELADRIRHIQHRIATRFRTQMLRTIPL